MTMPDPQTPPSAREDVAVIQEALESANTTVDRMREALLRRNAEQDRLTGALATVRVNLLRDPAQASAVSEFAAAILCGDSLADAATKAEKHSARHRQLGEERGRGDAWDHRYRPLKMGEIILPTDECQRDDGTWVLGVCVGRPAPDPCYTSHRTYRRLIATPASPPADRAGEVETICGAEMPDRLWLVDMGSGDVSWSAEERPDGEEPLERVAYVRAAALPSTPPAAMVPLDAIPTEIGRVKLSDRLSNGERYCGHSHDIPTGHPVYWPESMGEYDDRDPLCLAHAIEQAESDSGWCDCAVRDALDEDDATPPAADAGEAMRQAIINIEMVPVTPPASDFDKGWDAAIKAYRKQIAALATNGGEAGK